jgi:hypothetical protein
MRILLVIALSIMFCSCKSDSSPAPVVDASVSSDVAVKSDVLKPVIVDSTIKVVDSGIKIDK